MVYAGDAVAFTGTLNIAIARAWRLTCLNRGQYDPALYLGFRDLFET
jgi:hypothetical protein